MRLKYLKVNVMETINSIFYNCFLMFGTIRRPKQNERSRPRPVPNDLQANSLRTPGMFGHFGREPNTDYHYKMLQYQQRKESDLNARLKEKRTGLDKELFLLWHEQHAEHRQFLTKLDKQLQIQMTEYEASIDKRREKLKELLTGEEREFTKEAVDNALKGGLNRLEDMKKRSIELKAQREAERLETVKQKRLQQYMTRCSDLRTVLTQKYLVEAKNCNLMQIKDNEAKREAEKEIDGLWNEITIKEMQVKKEREEREAIGHYENQKQLKEAWDIQLKGKEVLQEEIERVTLEEGIELQKLNEEVKKEAIEAFIQKRKYRNDLNGNLREQLAHQYAIKAERKKEEDALDSAFVRLVELEIEREKTKAVDSKAFAKREIAEYRQNMKALKEQRKQDDITLNKCFECYKKDIERNQDEANCNIEKARRMLHEDVLKEREEQIRYKKKIAEEERKIKQSDNQLARYVYEVNNRLEIETTVQEKIAQQKYRQDLLKQIEYQKIIQEKEKQELKCQLAAGNEEEERYKKLISDICSGNIELQIKHPFRRGIEQYDCHCLKSSDKC
ncbi:hypothetical protein FQR65_LT00734 [Abscondita terminalis]|nr:hypothetical protein FQR65_LT00734 [Abscondita terminalis]